MSGTVKGKSVEFHFESQAGKVSYTGTVSGDMMEGSCSYGQVGERTFQGKRTE